MRTLLMVGLTVLISGVMFTTLLAQEKDSADKDIAKLIQQLGDDDFEVRAKAARELGNLGNPLAIEPLRKLLDDPKADTVAAVAQALDKLGCKEALNQAAVNLGERITKSKKNKPSFAIGYFDFDTDAYSGLIQLGKSSVPALVKAYKKPSVSAYVRICVIDALERIGDPLAVPLLLDIVKGNKDGAGYAVAALSKIGDETVFETVLNAAPRYFDDVVIGIHALIDRKIMKSSNCDVFLSGLESKNPEIMRISIIVFQRVRHKDSAAKLLSLLKNFPQGKNMLKAQVAEALGIQGDLSAVPALIDLYGGSTSSPRNRAAQQALYQLTGTAFNNREAWQKWLKKYEGMSRKERLLDYLKSQDEKTRMLAATALVELGSNEGINVLIEELSNGKTYVRRDAANSLAKTKDKSAILALEERLLKEEKWVVRKAMVSALGQLDAKSSIHPLIETLKDKNKRVRIEATIALKQITGQDFGEDYDKWLEWWEKNKEAK